MTTIGVKKKRPTKVSKSIQELLEESAKDDLVVTPPYNAFLSTWDETYPEHVILRIADVLRDNSRRTAQQRRWTWSASSAGQCMRRREFQFLGMPVVGSYDPQQKRIFLNGTWVHLRNQATLMSGDILDNIEVTIKMKKWRARCTMDGMGVVKQGRYDGADFGYELKSANDFAYQNQIIKGASEKTRNQVDFEFLLSGFDIFVIFNENKNNQSINEWVIVRDEDRVKKARDDLIELNKAVDSHTLHPQLPECKKRLRSGEFYKCPYGGDGGVCANSGLWPRKIPT